MNKKIAMSMRFAQLLVCGGIIGFQAARFFGLIGFDITPSLETAGASLGAVGVLGLKLLHVV